MISFRGSTTRSSSSARHASSSSAAGTDRTDTTAEDGSTGEGCKIRRQLIEQVAATWASFEIHSTITGNGRSSPVLSGTLSCPDGGGSSPFIFFFVVVALLCCCFPAHCSQRAPTVSPAVRVSERVICAANRLGERDLVHWVVLEVATKDGAPDGENVRGDAQTHPLLLNASALARIAAVRSDKGHKTNTDGCSVHAQLVQQKPRRRHQPPRKITFADATGDDQGVVLLEDILDEVLG